MLTAEESKMLLSFKDGIAFLADAWAAAPQPDTRYRIAEILREASRAYAILLEVNPENEGNLEAMESWAKRDRADQLKNSEIPSAKFHRNRALDGIAALRHGITDGETLKWLGNADGSLRAVAFGKRSFRACPDGGTVIGPHGLYDLSLKRMYFMLHYMYDFLQSVSGMENQHGRSQVTNIIKDTTNCMAIAARVYEEPKDPFCAVLKAREIMGLDVSQHYHFLLSALFPQLEKVADSWKHMDRAIWAMDVFPNEPSKSRCPGQRH
jgi:hypothetical protein